MRGRTSMLAIALLCATGADARPPRAAPAPARAQKTSSSAEDFERLLAQLEEREDLLEKEIAELEPQRLVIYRRMLARGRAYYRMVRAGLLPVGGGFDALVDHAAAMERLRSALGRDLAQQKRTEARLVAASEELRRTRTEKAPLIIQKEAMERARSALQQADERRDAFSRAFGGGSSLSDTAIYGTRAPSGEPLEPFSRRRGRLPLPLAGRAELMTPAAGPFENGVLVVASRDSDVRAVHPGQVTFVGRTAYGATVVIHHGENFFTVYGQLHHVEVKKGDTVGERARLGWVVRMGTRSPALYFEVRRGDEFLEAARWLGL